MSDRLSRRGILLAGGTATRLYPATLAVSKQLLPVYDKPMVYYPLSTLMLAGIREVLLISTPTDIPRFQALLGDGSQWGMRIEYAVQPKPEGIAQALVLAEAFLDGHPSALILGDNLFHGHELPVLLQAADAIADGATIFACHVQDPERYGVVVFDEARRAVSIEEKPAQPKSSYAVTGLYFYDATAPARAALLLPSARGELEITDLNVSYLREASLRVMLLGRGHAWLDTGTPDSLLEAGQFIAALERRQGLKVACVEEIAWRAGWIDATALMRAAEAHRNSTYSRYLRQLLVARDS